jgi:hypothetical protein
MEAVKQTFAVKPKGARVRVAKPILAPVPGGAAPVTRRAPLGRGRRTP